MQLARADAKLGGDRVHACARAPECHDRGAHERIELRAAQLNGSQQQRVRVRAPRQLLEQRRGHIASQNLGGIRRDATQLRRRQPQDRAGRARWQPSPN